MKIKKILYFIPLVIILTYSILNVYNARYLDSLYTSYFIKQIIWCCLGFLILFLCKFINVDKIFKLSFFFYLFCLLLLFFVLFFGSEVNGAKAWFNFKFFSFQPSEIMRVALALFLAFYTYKFNCTQQGDFKYILCMFIFTLIPSLLVFLEPDTGSIIFYLSILFTCLINSKISKKWYVLFTFLIVFLLVSFFYLYFFNQDLLINLIGTSFFYRTDRLLNFYKNTGYQIENALITIANSSFLGTGIGKILLYIPEGATDFMFSFSIGNFGILSGIIILICYYLIDLNLIKVKNSIKDKRNKIFISCFITMFLFQQFYNIFMNVNLLPIMGIPLPFLSYGGTSLIVYFIFLGLISKMYNYR